MADFGKKAKALGIQFIGICCGNSPYLVRALCKAIGKRCKNLPNEADMK